MLARIKALQGKMNEADLDLVLIMDPRDVYYYAGTGQPANLVVPREGDPILQIRRAWDFAVRECYFDQKFLLKGGNFKNLYHKVESLDYPRRHLGVAMDAIPASLVKKVEESFPSCLLFDASPLILSQRSIKDEQELKMIRAAARCYEKAHEVILNELRPGISELSLSANILAAVRGEGADTIIRNRRWDASLAPDGIVASSKTSWQVSGHAMTVTGKGLSAALPWGASGETIEQGDLVVVDLGINYQGYHADVARTYVVGEADQKQQEVFEQVYSLQEAALQSIKSGVLAEDVYWLAYEKAVEMNVIQYFQGHGEMQGDYIGHGLGLEIDEPPILQIDNRTRLSSGMVFAIEPKLIIPGWGAVVLEDDVAVTDTGYTLLSTVPRRLFMVDA